MLHPVHAQKEKNQREGYHVLLTGTLSAHQESLLCDTLLPQECRYFSGAHHLFITFHSPQHITFMLRWTSTRRSALQLLFHKLDTQTHKAMQY